MPSRQEGWRRVWLQRPASWHQVKSADPRRDTPSKPPFPCKAGFSF